MDNANPKQQLLEKLKSSTNILVTVSANPSVDQLAACLGLTLWLNKLGKHATAVFSGEVPSTMEFLQPAETLEKNTDSLRDFIIALDKSKADKLRYKVEDKVVKIFITPYRTSLSAEDLEFSQGDFNVDMVVAVGVSVQEDLDAAITAHGRILHDATVTSIDTKPETNLGSINWNDAQASSLSELIVDLGNDLDRTQLDEQIATALLTGIVAETDRFSNEKTTPQTMSVSAELMSAGANQQLVASKLEEPVIPPADKPAGDTEAENTNGEAQEPAKSPDGTLEIEHQDAEDDKDQAPADDQAEPPQELPVEPEQPPEESQPSVEQNPEADVSAEVPAVSDDEIKLPSDNYDKLPKLVTEPPTLGGTLTANSRPDDDKPDRVTDPLSLPTVEADQPLLDHVDGATPPPPSDQLQPAPPSWMPQQPWLNPAPTPAADQSQAAPAEPPKPQDDTPAPAVGPNETLVEIEQSVDSPHLEGESSNPADLDTARDEVTRAINSAPDATPAPIQALNAQSIDLNAPEGDSSVTLPAAPAPQSTAFDPNAFSVMNDPEVSSTEVTPVADSTQPAAPAPTAEEMSGPIDQPFTMPLPTTLTPPPANPVPPTSSSVTDPTAPPPVPPPLMPRGFPPAA